MDAWLLDTREKTARELWWTNAALFSVGCSFITLAYTHTHTPVPKCGKAWLMHIPHAHRTTPIKTNVAQVISLLCPSIRDASVGHSFYVFEFLHFIYHVSFRSKTNKMWFVGKMQHMQTKRRADTINGCQRHSASPLHSLYTPRRLIRDCVYVRFFVVVEFRLSPPFYVFRQISISFRRLTGAVLSRVHREKLTFTHSYIGFRSFGDGK